MSGCYYWHMNFANVAAIFSTVLSIYCGIPYVRAILAHKTKPHQLSWLVFTIMNGIVFGSQFLAGGRRSVILSFVFFVGSFVNFVLSLKFGTRDTSRWDRTLFAFALITIVVWALTRSNSAAIWLTLVIDVAATAMMVLKLRAEPRSEDPHPWMLVTAAYVFTCLTLVGRPFGILYVRPLYGLACNSIFVGSIFYYRKRAKRQQVALSPPEI